VRTTKVKVPVSLVFMLVEIWSDVACPWCWVGKRRFETALAGFGHRDQVEVVWRSFELDPVAPIRVEGDPVDHLARKYGMTRQQADQRVDHLAEVGRQEGIDLRLRSLRRGNTFDAHRLLHLAAESGGDLQHRLKDRLFHGYFTESLSVADPAVLTRLAVEVGLPAAQVAEVLASDRYADAVRADEATAAGFGISAVPFFVFDRAYGVPGAQAPEVLADVLEKAWSEQPVAPVTSSGEACEDGACPV
jgi:predicted DsbA family dithiol-disulfide isomerase